MSDDLFGKKDSDPIDRFYVLGLHFCPACISCSTSFFVQYSQTPKPRSQNRTKYKGAPIVLKFWIMQHSVVAPIFSFKIKVSIPRPSKFSKGMLAPPSTISRSLPLPPASLLTCLSSTRGFSSIISSATHSVRAMLYHSVTRSPLRLFRIIITHLKTSTVTLRLHGKI